MVRSATTAHVAGLWPFSLFSSAKETVSETAESISSGFKWALLLGGAVAIYWVYRTTKTIGEQQKQAMQILPVVLAPEAKLAGSLSERMTSALATE